MSNKRRMMCLDLAGVRQISASDATVRPLVSTDARALAELMFDAYRGTIDDTGAPLSAAETEVKKTFEGDYGSMIWDASFVAPSPVEPARLASASVVTLWRGAPLLAFAMTAPSLKRRGFAARLIVASALALSELGHEKLLLVVTCGNAPAERLYEKLGFREVPA